MSYKTDLKIIAALIMMLIVVLIVLTDMTHRSRPTVEPDYISSFYGSRDKTDPDKIYFNEDMLEVAAFWYNMCCGTDYTGKDIEHAYFEKNEIYSNYLELFSGNCIKEIYWGFEYITSKEYDCIFADLSYRQKQNVEKIYLEEQQLAYEYYGKEFNFFRLTEEQQLEFYYLYKDPDYKLNDEILKMEDNE
ncbi:hypothetical protein SAMN02910298_01760 [Pseudobutyrivibrio sp. YE44]|uniref:hypothetical protein n=1 Tax=Pseudobutyrivibrio sp. YE44 TaxID=1520802 RepID=UPI000883F016|nr:hypothetical protein [Pseudobutyrivibrio sp. YE44]SDB35634.1 hypothetical protein SAMN02910298_01760 [Pseudobutyrivibrio sp. YE44]